MRTTRVDNIAHTTEVSWNVPLPLAQVRKYDALGRLLEIATSEQILSYAYDGANRLKAETRDILLADVPAGAKQTTVSYSYDRDGRRAGLGYPGVLGEGVEYFYTPRGQLEKITAEGDPDNVHVEYLYNALGQRNFRYVANRKLTEWNFYDDLQRLEQRRLLFGASGTPMHKFAYKYKDKTDYIQQKAFSAGATPLYTENYSYDAAGQLTTNGGFYNGFGGINIEGFQYDENGNRTTARDTATGATAYEPTNALNQYTAIGDHTYKAHDKNGNFIGMSDCISYIMEATDGSGTSAYTADNRLKGFVRLNLTEPEANRRAEAKFHYDALNRQWKREINGVAEYFNWDGWRLLGVLDENGNKVEKYLNGANIDEVVSFAKTNKIVGTSDPLVQTFYPMTDHLGSVALLADENAAIAEYYTYTAFGKPTAFNSNREKITNFTSRHLFTGREYIPQIDLYDYRNRFYSADLGRFLTTDPIRFDAGDVNLYRYVGNSPSFWIDPWGLATTFPGADDGTPSTSSPDGNHDSPGMKSGCPDGQVQDDAYRCCCPSEMGEITRYDRAPASNGHNIPHTWGGSQKASEESETTGGFKPVKAFDPYGPGYYDTPEDGAGSQTSSQTFRACPETIDKYRSYPPHDTYNGVDYGSGENCTGAQCNRQSFSGLPPHGHNKGDSFPNRRR